MSEHEENNQTEFNDVFNGEGDVPEVKPAEGPNFTEAAGPVLTEEAKLKQASLLALAGTDSQSMQDAMAKKYPDDQSTPANVKDISAMLEHQFSVSIAEEHLYHNCTPWAGEMNYLTDYQHMHVRSPSAFFNNQLTVGQGDKQNKLGMRYARFTGRGKQSLSGNAAVLAITAGMGLSSPVQVPLVDSGMRWVISSPTQEDFTSLEERLGLEKGELGRQTLGYIFSYSDLYMIEIIFDFFTNYITDCNVNGWMINGVVDKDLLFSLTKLTDLHDLAAAFLAARYPNGHNLKQPCTSEVADCNHVHEGRVQFVNMLFIDEHALTPDQLSFMTHAISHKHSPQEVIAYQESIVRPHDTYDLDCGGGKVLNFKFGIPAIEVFTGTGKQWINTTKRIINESVRNLNDTQQTKKFLDKLILNNELKLFTCWIKEIKYVNEDNEISVDDFNTITRIVESLDKEPELIEKTLNALWDYISWASLSVVGVPQLRCRACNKVQTDTSKSYPSIIPINVMNVFFTLLTPSQSPVAGIMSSIQRLASSST